MTDSSRSHRFHVRRRQAALGLQRALLPGTLLLLAFLLAPLRPALAQDEGPGVHIVQPGETLSEIAKANELTVEQLMRVNGIPNPDAIYVGQELRLPINNRPPGVTVHVVRQGEALSMIARLYEVDMRALMSANNIRSADDIFWGQELIIPGTEAEEGAAAATGTPAADATAAATAAASATPRPTTPPSATPAPSGPTVHTVRAGETAGEIAKQYGVRLADLLAVNGIANANLLRTGTELVIPAGEGAATPTATPAAPSGEPQVEVIKPTVQVIDMQIPTPVPLPERPAASLNRTYTVVSGDTPARIALRLGIDTESLLRMNNLERNARLRAGQALLLPATDRELRVVGESQQYVVQPGDSLSEIARKFGLNLADLMSANRISNPNTISVGERLIVPGREKTSNSPVKRVGPSRSGYYYYTVLPGDTISELARNLNTTRLALIEYNNLPDESTVFNGMELRIPFGAPALPVRLPPVPISGSSFLVSLSRQQCWVYRGSEVRYAWTCSTGHGQWRTRTGSFKVQSKIEMAKSNVWRLDMPFWLGIYDVGRVENGIHGLPVDWDTGRKIWTQLIGQPATFGCAMLSDEDAETLFNLAYLGMPVHIIQ